MAIVDRQRIDPSRPRALARDDDRIARERVAGSRDDAAPNGPHEGDSDGYGAAIGAFGLWISIRIIDWRLARRRAREAERKDPE